MGEKWGESEKTVYWQRVSQEISLEVGRVCVLTNFDRCAILNVTVLSALGVVMIQEKK